ncbi:hypothetical protein SAMN04488001_2284 [Litoreibacter albidus]|uniref:Uncharacterized protein n=2 Tax=Litoreibacter albidus TaxID=670155 RepID=A0A1H2YBP0_9RHOB|nr:hypothetical protein SAMN04488001_2284 [Litoreibacter albidus]
MVGYSLVTMLIVVAGVAVVLPMIEPQSNVRYQTVKILARGTSSVSDQSAARGEPLVEVQLPDGQILRLPGMYYAVHTTLETACLRTSQGRFTGVIKRDLRPINQCG